ncbi:hypothetical protein PV08_09374 [Exophiala spinifera]|uniref:Uncharacterized protein n=1 Tax=Exophiala spinifera TaxID=91928 RepID=A0A0D2B080_9EURO|nr:uncharacterized protein PV08_09374 [Exophiala spinifera]KIW12100.1 hypothetical protein PV08_09374 [Exophiala spinifera]
MAGLSTQGAQAQPKSMSSRLLNMKFMQRAAASTATSPAAATQSSSSPGVVHQPSKRRRIDYETSSPSSTPGTPQTPTTEPQISTFGQSRGGISTFDRGEGADTEWVLDLKMTFPNPSQTAHGSRKDGDRVNGTRFNQLSQITDGDSDSEEDDIWNNGPPGRQTYGSFKTKRGSRSQAARDVGNGADSPSDESDGEEGEEHDHSNHRTPTRNRKKAESKGDDSDEEMKQVRRAIEAKHRNMSGQGQVHRGSPGGGGWNSRSPVAGNPGQGPKRRREEGNYKAHKKARKTI